MKRAERRFSSVVIKYRGALASGEQCDSQWGWTAVGLAGSGASTVMQQGDARGDELELILRHDTAEN
jgi:hypothetical protein